MSLGIQVNSPSVETTEDMQSRVDFQAEIFVRIGWQPGPQRIAANCADIFRFAVRAARNSATQASSC